MKNLIEFLSNYSVNYAFTSGILLTVLIIAIICIIILYLRLKEAKTSLKKELFFNKVSAETIKGYEHQIKRQEVIIREQKHLLSQKVTFSEELKKSFNKACERINELEVQKEDAISQIMELVGKCKSLENELRIAYERIEALVSQNSNLTKSKFEIIKELNTLKESLTYWKERALHQKHTKKVVESEYYKCFTSEFFPNFIDGYAYKIGTRISSDSLISLFDENKNECIVNRKHFKPVTK